MKNTTRSNSILKTIALICLCAALLCAFACTEENLTQDEPVSVTQEFRVVQDYPSYPGGMDAFYKHIMQEVRYPRQARRNGVEGIVQVQFVVDRDGSVTNVQTVKGIGEGCDEEAVRVIKRAANFAPGRQRGRTVRVKMSVPIEFKLETETNPDGTRQGSINIGEILPMLARFKKIKAKYHDGTYTGTIYDADGQVLPDASIIVVGTQRGTVSDTDGTFTIGASTTEEIHVLFVGYETLRLVPNE